MNLNITVLVFLISSALIPLEAMDMDDHDDWEREQTQAYNDKDEKFNCKTCLCSSAICLGLTGVSAYITGVFDEGHQLRPINSYGETERHQLMFDTTFGGLAGVVCFDQLKKFYRQYLQRAPKSQKVNYSRLKSKACN